MRFLAASLLVGSTLAAPQPVDQVKRDGSCPPEPAGSGPVPSPDTAEAFLSSSVLSNLANQASTPSGYTLAYQNASSALSAANYMGYFTLQSYDPSSCASACDKTQGCTAFNIYMERNPTVEPNADSCSNPPSTNKIGCSFWGSVATLGQATNTGQWRNNFHVVIAGSNAYNKVTWTAQAVGKAAMGPVQPASTAGTAMNTTLDGSDVSLKMSQPITTDSSKQYIFKANFLFNDGAGNCTIYGQPGNLNVAYYLVHYPSNSWQYMSLPFFGNSQGQNMGMFITCPDASAAAVAWDNVNVVPNNGPVRGAG